MGSYSVIVFLGKFEGILVKPCLEQSTITPSLAQWHLSGQVKSAAQTVDEFSPTRTEINTIITQDFILNNYSWSWWIFFHVIMARMKKKSTNTDFLANQWISLVHFANETNKLRRDTCKKKRGAVAAIERQFGFSAPRSVPRRPPLVELRTE